MEFLLFSKVTFEIADPIAFLEAYCVQSDFYSNYDVLLNRQVEDVNKIGARLKLYNDKKRQQPSCLLKKIKTINQSTKKIEIFQLAVDDFLKICVGDRTRYIEDLYENVIEKLCAQKGISLSTATKILHTRYPEIIPIIDNLLQDKYRDINRIHRGKKLDGCDILRDYYNNLKEAKNTDNLARISRELSKNNLRHLTKIRIFDILWWSYLKSEGLIKQYGINWKTIR